MHTDLRKRCVVPGGSGRLAPALFVYPPVLVPSGVGTCRKTDWLRSLLSLLRGHFGLARFCLLWPGSLNPKQLWRKLGK